MSSVWRTTDFATWATIYRDAAASFTTLARCGDAVVVLVTGARFARSSDGGASFTGGALPAAYNVAAVACSGSGFVAVGRNAAGGNVTLTSANGSDWVEHAAAADSFSIVYFAGHYFVAGGLQLMSSVDGVTWTTVKTDGTPYGTVAVAGGLLFVAYLSNPLTCAVSSDGIHFDAQPFAFDAVTSSGSNFFALSSGNVLRIPAP